ncbi:hypothetical protein CPB86DRAFT_820267 [Serendipita vermifera]|nr:hypothetical protein CPB86DRAFT_820267 [Serendipita vermifera]
MSHHFLCIRGPNKIAHLTPPLPMVTQVRLWVFIQEWVPILTIPVEEIPGFTVSPHKWFRFLCGTIYGPRHSIIEILRIKALMITSVALSVWLMHIVLFVAKNLDSTMTTPIRLWLHIADEWHPVLSIPRYHFDLHTTRPLKWLRYLGFAIYGREGILRETRDGLEIGNYMTRNVDALLSDYFYYSPGGHRAVDIHMLDDRTSLHGLDSFSSASSFDFDIVERDKTCVVTGMRNATCNVVHLVPHAKGDDYISSLTRLRGLSERDVIGDIDDLRNGLLILAPLHAFLRDGEVAFLKTPNFAMDPEDVPLAHKLPPARIDNNHHYHSTRWTMQYFSDTEGAFQVQHYLNVPHNTDLLVPADLTDWPADFLFDILYGCVALKRWGQEGEIEAMLATASNLVRRGHLSPSPQPEELSKEQNDDHVRETQGESRPDELDSVVDMFDKLAIIWRHSNSPQDQNPVTSHIPRRQDVQEKVSDWLQTVDTKTVQAQTTSNPLV